MPDDAEWQQEASAQPEGVAPGVDVVINLAQEAFRRGDARRAALLIRDAWFDVLSERPTRVRALLEEVPPAHLAEHPTLLMMLGLLLHGEPHRRASALRYFVSATRSQRAGHHGVDSVDRALLLVSEGVGHRLIGNAAAGVAPARAAIALLDSLDHTEQRSVPHLSRLYAQAGVTLYDGGAVDEALDVFRKGLAETNGRTASRGFTNLAMLAGIHALRGDLSITDHYLKLARSDLWSDRQRSMYTGTFYRLAEAITLLERFDHSAAQDQLDAMVHDPRTIEYWLPIAVVQSFVGLVRGQPGAALASLDAAVAARDGDRGGVARSRLAPVRVILNLAMGRMDAAAVIAQRDLPPGAERRLAVARVNLAVDRPGAALRELRSMVAYETSFRTRVEAATVEAAALLRLRSSVRSPVVVDHLGSLLDETGQTLALGMLSVDDFERVHGALSRSRHATVLENVPVRSLYLDTPDLPKPLSERELVVLQQLMHTSSVTRIASELVVSANTVKTQLRGLYRKLGASNRDEAIAVALDRHLITHNVR